jgi:hypothetical protein
VFFVVDPVAFRGEPFAGSDRGERTDDREKIAAAFGFYLEDREAGLVVEKRDALDQAADRFDGFGCAFIDFFDG